MNKVKNKKNLAELIRPYAKNKLWVALDKKGIKIMGVGKNPREAIDKARKQGVEAPSIIQARLDYGTLIPCLRQ